MKWVVLAGFIACLATLSEESALKCAAGVDCPCEKDKKVEDVQGPVDTTSQILNSTDSIMQAEVTVVECLAGSVWENDCLTCRCTEQGRKVCEESNKCKNATGIKQNDLLPGKECLPGSEWDSQCMRCKCNEEGIPTCTGLPCVEKTDEPAFTCEPGTFWKIDCNTCSCSSTGQGSCTRMGCNINTVIDFNPDRNDSPEKEDVKLEFDEVNEIDLVDRNIVKRNPTERSVCRPNLTFKLDCNYCNCDAEGASYTCTNNECMEADVNKDVEVFMEDEGNDHIERHSVCKPRSVFYANCNACHCNIDGSDFSCANKPCPVPEDVELFHELRVVKSLVEMNSTKPVVCPANRMFVKDCNTCWCNDDGTSYYCTRKVCVDTTDELDNTEKAENFHKIIQECQPDEVFELNCNMCRCNADGKSYSCTRRMCATEKTDKPVKRRRMHTGKKRVVVETTRLTLYVLNGRPAKESKLQSVRRRRATTQSNTRTADASAPRFAQLVKGTPKACKPGQEFRMDCNKCLCDNEGQDFSCTRIDCTALSNNNGSPRKKREVSSQMTKNCEPGSVFDQECNVCRCSADGIHATCTTKRCKEDTSENDVNVPDADPSFRCTPGEQFKRGCNDCTCSADGKSVFCTLRLCDQDITPTI